MASVDQLQISDETPVQSTGTVFHAPRARAFVIGIPLLVFISMLSVYSDMVAKTVQFGVLQIAPPAIVILFILTLLNQVSAWFSKRAFLSQADLLVVYVMLLVGVMVSTRGAIEKLIPSMAYLPYYSNASNDYHDLILRHLPSWALPVMPTLNGTPEIIRAYYERLRPGEPIPYGVWVAPLCSWGVLVGAVVWIFACLATVLRRQWVENERLSFPLTALPVAMMQEDQSGRTALFREPLMWLGFGIAVAVFTLNGLQSNFPTLPHIPLRVDISPLLTTPPWNQVTSFTMWISLAAIAFMFFLPNDLLFSLWFFFLLTEAQNVIFGSFNIPIRSIGTHDCSVWAGYQAAGGYLVLIFAYTRLAMPYLKQAWQTAFTKNRPLDDSIELMSYRTAFIGMATGYAVIILWLTLAGMNPLLAALQMGIYIFIIAVIMTRAVNEAGLLITETSFLPSHLIQLFVPLPALGAGNLSLLAMTNIAFTRDLRGVLLSPMMDGQRIAHDLHVHPRRLALPLVIAVVVAFIVASFVFLTVHYTLGGSNLYAYPNQNAGNLYSMAANAAKGNPPIVDWQCYGGLILGGLVTSVLVFCRGAFPGFPLNPIAYVVAPTWAMIVLWFPCLVAWLIKTPVLRFGGINLYRKLSPLMLGLILGEFTMAVFWAIASFPIFGASAPLFPWP